VSREGDAIDSGLAWLTGRAQGPALVPPGRAATVARELGTRFGVDGAGLLTERAALQGFSRRAPWSAGGHCRAVRCAGGWLALSLSREWDREAVAALVSRDHVDEPWAAVDAWAVGTPVDEVVERCLLLGLAAGRIPAVATPEPPVIITRSADPGAPVETPIVVCLASLWAGPLAAHLLGLAGAVVIFVESVDRPDPVRDSCPPLHSLLRSGSTTVRLHLPGQVPDLRQLLRQADVVIEGSRPRVLQQWGITPEEVLAESPTTWVSITAHGREEPDRIGFGDDAAMAGGQVIWSAEGVPWPVGDALGDPLAGPTVGESCWTSLCVGWRLTPAAPRRSWRLRAPRPRGRGADAPAGRRGRWRAVRCARRERAGVGHRPAHASGR
jgi:hypothetical protein